MTYDADLNLIVCEHATSSLVRERPDGRRETLASHFDRQELNSPNDVCVRSDGSIYFSDPGTGGCRSMASSGRGSSASRASTACRPGGGQPQLLVDRHLFDQPNGLCFSPDESLLYVNDTVQTLIRVFDVSRDGSLSNGRIFASGIRSSLEAGVPDGMKCDQRGNVWVTAPGGVWVYAPSGDLLGKVRVPELVANLAWGGPDFHTLFLTATHSRLPGDDQGRAAARAVHVGLGREPVRFVRWRGAPGVAPPPRRSTRTSGSIRAAARSSSRICRTT